MMHNQKYDSQKSTETMKVIPTFQILKISMKKYLEKISDNMILFGIKVFYEIKYNTVEKSDNDHISSFNTRRSMLHDFTDNSAVWYVPVPCFS